MSGEQCLRDHALWPRNLRAELRIAGREIWEHIRIGATEGLFDGCGTTPRTRPLHSQVIKGAKKVQKG